MAMRHRDAPAHGIQFHPESIATAHGAALLGAFVAPVPRKTLDDVRFVSYTFPVRSIWGSRDAHRQAT